MSLEFGLTITLVGIAYVFSALTLVAVACWMLKKIFKEERADGNGAGGEGGERGS